MFGPYQYRFGPNTLGIGVDNMALERPGIAIDNPNYGSRYAVLASFSPCEGGQQFPLTNIGPTNDLRHNGVYMSGDLALMALADFNKSLSKGK